MDIVVSPLAPDTYPDCPILDGIFLATAEAGIKYSGRHDVLLVRFERPAQVAGVFTRSKCPSAPVVWCQTHLARGAARGLMVNSGNANAFTGRRGAESVELSAKTAAAPLGCAPEDICLASTGVIGEPLDPSKFAGVIDDLAQNGAPDGYMQAARAIMTTDTFPKLATRTFHVDGKTYHINGIAKGSGMIAPDMATMLSFLFTDAPLSSPVLQTLLGRLVDTSFNAITVDSDTSTSDTVMIFGLPERNAGLVENIDHPVAAAFSTEFKSILTELAHWIVRDGEGARKFVEISVSGAESAVSAKAIALSIANSPLVKTAIAGEDANWGRIVMAVGKAGEPADRDRLAIWFGDTRVAVDGERDSGYDEDFVSEYMKNQDLKIHVDIGLGAGEATVWTCDLTKQYVAINGDYRS